MPFLACQCLRDSGRFRSRRVGLLGLFRGGFRRGPFNFLGKIETRGRDNFLHSLVLGWLVENAALTIQTFVELLIMNTVTGLKGV